MRAPTAILLVVVAGSAIGSPGCANRGMHAGTDGGPGDAVVTGTAGRGGAGATAGRGGTGGSAGTGGGPTGIGGTAGQTAGTGGGSCSLAAGAAATGGACSAMFNFEAGSHNALINSGSTAFTAVMPSSTFTFCGSGALAITGLFSGTSGPTTKGEVLINLPSSPVDLTGKTITVHIAANPGCSADLALFLLVNTQSGSFTIAAPFPLKPVTNMWKTGSATVPAVAGSTTALALSLQVFSYTGYQGTIYVDEIDIR